VQPHQRDQAATYQVHPVRPIQVHSAVRPAAYLSNVSHTARVSAAHVAIMPSREATGSCHRPRQRLPGPGVARSAVLRALRANRVAPVALGAVKWCRRARPVRRCQASAGRLGEGRLPLRPWPLRHGQAGSRRRTGNCLPWP
jgi:hypothetical protein